MLVIANELGEHDQIYDNNHLLSVWALYMGALYHRNYFSNIKITTINIFERN